jgi:hypothetical protein
LCLDGAGQTVSLSGDLEQRIPRREIAESFCRRPKLLGLIPKVECLTLQQSALLSICRHG